MSTRSLFTMTAPVITVMVVDDHALHRDGTRQILDAINHLKAVAITGNQRLENGGSRVDHAVSIMQL